MDAKIFQSTMYVYSADLVCIQSTYIIPSVHNKLLVMLTSLMTTANACRELAMCVLRI